MTRTKPSSSTATTSSSGELRSRRPLRSAAIAGSLVQPERRLVVRERRRGLRDEVGLQSDVDRTTADRAMTLSAQRVEEPGAERLVNVLARRIHDRLALHS